MTPQPSTATVSRRVEWVDTDASGHQHNSLIMRLVEAAEHQLIRDVGILDAYFSCAPRVRHEIDFVGKLYFGQPVTATIVCERVGRASISYTFEVWGEEYNATPRRRAASGRVIVAHVPAGLERATAWPDEIRDALVPSTGAADV